MHILLILQEIYQNFNTFPQKYVLKQVFTSIWGWQNFANIYQVYISQKAISLHNSAGVCNTSGKNTYC